MLFHPSILLPHYLVIHLFLQFSDERLIKSQRREKCRVEGSEKVLAFWLLRTGEMPAIRLPIATQLTYFEIKNRSQFSSRTYIFLKVKWRIYIYCKKLDKSENYAKVAPILPKMNRYKGRSICWDFPHSFQDVCLGFLGEARSWYLFIKPRQVWSINDFSPIQFVFGTKVGITS